MSEQDLRANPYVGLRPFLTDDSLYFFGREQQTAALLEILRAQRFLGVVGSSGSGKSSLVYAGLLPALRGGFLVGDRDHWHIVQMKPGGAPIFNLATGLVKAVGKPLDGRIALDRAIRDEHTDAIIKFLTPELKSNENVFLLVDQFEELFAFRGVDRDDSLESPDPDRHRQRAARKAEAADFVDLIMALAQRDLPIYVTLTMRTDFLGDCDLFYGLPEALNRGRYLVPRMAREQLREAIECPALLKPGAQIAPRLIDHLLNELGDRFDRLPVLQHALLRTWDVWQQAGGTGLIDLRHYEEAGGLERALDLDAESALDGLDQTTTARVFKRLTKTDVSQRRVRDPARISELIAASGADRAAVDDIIRHFEENGRSFVHASSEDDANDPRVDISHESLIRQWERLRTWVDEERASRDRYIELVARARKWEREEAGLLAGPELRGYVNWNTSEAPTPGWARRYFDAADAFKSAMLYLDKSLEVQDHSVAEVELQRQWALPWRRLSILAGVLIGFVLIVHPPFLARPPFLDMVKSFVEAIDDANKSGDIDKWFWVVVVFSSLSLVVSLYLGACVAANRYAQRLHRKIVFPRILKDIVSSRDPSSTAAKAKAEFRDAAEVNNTTYAPVLRRVGAFWVDFFLQTVIACVLVVLAIALIYYSFDYGYLAYLVCLLAFNWSYSVLQIASKRQATLGMWIFGIYRTDLRGARLSVGRASAWWLVRLLVSTPPYGAGFLTQPFTKKGQTLHDWLAGSVVLLRPPATVASGVSSASRGATPPGPVY
jgi:uncharacterized RDD family membrane protein YckC/energy-coupling factor transporter ATP-binding protein EcfA2